MLIIPVLERIFKVHTQRTHNIALSANITDTATKYYEPGWMDGGDKGETASFIAVHVNKKKKKLNKRESIYMYRYCPYTDKGTENGVSGVCQNTESRQGRTAGKEGNR